MTPISIIPCGEEELEWLGRLPGGHLQPDEKGWPEFTFPSERSGLRKRWQVALLLVADELRAIVIARRGDNVGRVGSRFAVQAWRPFTQGIPVSGLKQAGDIVSSALDLDHPLTELEEQALIAVLSSWESWLPETVEEWRRQVDPPPIPEELIGQLSFERDCMRAALGLAALPNEHVEAYGFERGQRGFLPGVRSGIRPSEDSMIRHDWANLIGWDPPEDTFFDARTFTSPSGRNRLTLLYTNREDLERTTGADLIYIDETRNSLVIVQYKRLKDRAPGGGPGYRPDEQLEEELKRMRSLRQWLRDQPRSPGSESYRLHADPCFIKLCDPVVDLDLGTAPVPGMVFPLGLFDAVHLELQGSGPRGGTCITKNNVPRSLGSTDFIDMIKAGWLGTNVTGDVVRALGDYCESALAEGKSITTARVNRKNSRLRRPKAQDRLAIQARQAPLF